MAFAKKNDFPGDFLKPIFNFMRFPKLSGKLQEIAGNLVWNGWSMVLYDAQPTGVIEQIMFHNFFESIINFIIEFKKQFWGN